MIVPTVCSKFVSLLATLGLVSGGQPDAVHTLPAARAVVADTITSLASSSATVDVAAFARPDYSREELRRHALSPAAIAGFDAEHLRRAQRAIDAEIDRGGFPGAALAIGRFDQVVVEYGAGRLGWAAHEPRVDPDFTVYDLASLTKVVAATTAVMLLVEDGRMHLDAPVAATFRSTSAAGGNMSRSGTC